MTADPILSVSQLTRRIQTSLEDFGTLSVQGELSQAKVAPSGHFYATLKDREAIISLVMWRSQVVRNGPIPREGAQVLVRGSLSVYGPRGQYQLTATRITPQGLGDLAAQFEALKRRLSEEGLFDEERKIPLPYLPCGVGLATAAGSAALADLLDSIRTRFPSMPIVHEACLVQGSEAPAQIVAAIQRLERNPAIDVIIVGRGGGSLEDLWAFNDERVVRAIAACEKPIVSAVGHETDFTLADFAADVRAKTPTAAGEVIVPVESDLRDQLSSWHQQLDQAMARLVGDVRQRLDAYARHRALAGPAYQIALRQQRLDEAAALLRQTVDRRMTAEQTRLALQAARLDGRAPTARIAEARQNLDRHRHQLDQQVQVVVRQYGERFVSAVARLDGLSPLAVVARGYSVVHAENGLTVRHLDQAPVGSAIAARTTDGWIDATVVAHRRQRLNEAGPDYQP